MEKTPVYTIGHGTRKSEELLAALQEYGIKYLLDVRSMPFSKFNPQFNRDSLSLFLEQHSIKYVFMGDSLGGRPSDRTCYDIEGKVNYEMVKTKDFFRQGIERVKTAYDKNIPIALMCSESKPQDCHRSKLIGRVLSSDNILIKHIDEKGKIRTQTDVINELNKGLPGITLFPQELQD